MFLELQKTELDQDDWFGRVQRNLSIILSRSRSES
jgi:hypothetical protein